MRRLITRFGASRSPDPAAAVDELRAAIHQPDAAAVFVFCSSSYDLDALGRALRRAFTCPVVGCTTAGQIGPGGYQRGGITAASLASPELVVQPHLLSPLAAAPRAAAVLGARLRGRAGAADPSRRAFGLLFVDGLSLAEEGLVAALYTAMGGLPIVGGSAGDDLAFRRTAVYWDGAFVSDAAVFATCDTSLPFTAFKLQHFAPSERKLVITAAEPAARVVREIDGLPAVEGYARAAGVPVDAVDGAFFSAHPLILDVGGEQCVRSIARAEPDGSLGMFCAIDEGLVLSVAQGLDPLAALEREFARVQAEIGRPELVLGCDCILRRLELEQRGLDGAVGAFLERSRVLGFSTYGEQLNAVHVNQTFTGLALAG